MSRKISHRRYLPQECANPACQDIFVPHDRRQIYCEPQCRINANNDRRYFENNTRFFDEKIARRNCKILEFIWEKISLRKYKIVSRERLDFEEFDFDSPHQVTVNPKTGREIRWYHNFGLENYPFTDKLFTLYKR